MKRGIIIGMAAVCALNVLAGCGKKSEEDEGTQVVKEDVSEKDTEQESGNEEETLSAEEKKSVEAVERLSELGYGLEDFNIYLRNPANEDENREFKESLMKKLASLYTPGTKEYEQKECEVDALMYEQYEIEQETPIILKVRERNNLFSGGYGEEYAYMSDEGYLFKEGSTWYEIKVPDEAKSSCPVISSILIRNSYEREGIIITDTISYIGNTKTEAEIRKEIEESYQGEHNGSWRKITGTDMEINVYVITDKSETDGSSYYSAWITAYYKFYNDNIIERYIRTEAYDSIVEEYTTDEKLLELLDISKYE